MSRHGRVIQERMLESIDSCREGRLDLPRLLRDLAAMYESLGAPERPEERAWLDHVIPLERAVQATTPHDRREISQRVQTHLGGLRDLIDRCRRIRTEVNPAG